ncbi:hypothetical protein SUGI_0556010 [Cryptomeria japonica]|uniref:7-deoxyloganetin glucosyltransferase n=1 Tax=Cryptomeria japonica TaxID=3369 RepID=UPI002408B6AC|nr:7-deoxyloganetin glucosyltransferase [Cryptomeria japonica]GLJ28287.1 hypothetical protein SUGI_0556010 [Cryptomeria japonica]
MVKRRHALMLPYPAQGHVKPMMQLSKILAARGYYITFVNTDYIHDRMVKSGSAHSGVDFRFETISDELPPEHGRTHQIDELSESLVDNGPAQLENLVEKLKALPDLPPFTCIVYDGCMSWAQKTATRLDIPGVSFWTPSACGFYIYLSWPLLKEMGYIPLKDKSYLTNGYMEEEISCIPGMPPFRMKDVPNFCHDATNYMFKFVETQGQAAFSADSIILNTFDELEGPVMKELQERLPVYSIGPLLLEQKNGFSDSSANIWAAEPSCLQWLDEQEPGSVVYVCFGSITVMSDEELVEFAWGLEASKQSFLWVIRPDISHGASAKLPVEFVEKVKGRGFFVSWAPQMEVLSHPSVGGFLTHSGWNSTIEAICAGVPMICWPFFAEQQLNRTYVSQVWKIGMAMKDVVERGEVEEMVKRLMSGKEGEEMRTRICELRDASIRAMKEGGSSYNNLEKLFVEIEEENRS